MAYFRKRGEKWEYRIKYTDKRTGGLKEKSKGGFRTKKEAQLAAQEEEKAINYFGFASDGEEDVSTYFEQWLETYKRPHVKPITFTVQERNVRLNILPRWGSYKLKDLKRNEYQQWINELRKHYSEGTVRRIHSIMSSALNDAVCEFQIMRTHPLQRIKIPKETEKSKKVKFFTREQLEVFLLTLKKPARYTRYRLSIQYYALFTLLARTGLRIGEALALTWDDIDLKKQTLTVNKTIVYPVNSEPYISTTKTGRSERTIKLDDHTVNVLKQHRTNRKEVVLRYEDYKPAKNNIVFHQQGGRWLRSNVTRAYFKEVCKRANLPVLSPHALRHSHAVHLLEAGVNLKYVSERLGHASVKITADTYLHVTRKIEDEALELYGRHIGNI